MLTYIADNMRQVKIVILLLALVILALLSWLFVIPLFKSSSAFLKVTTKETKSRVLLNGKLVGKTPYLGKKLPIGEFTVKIIGSLNEEEVSFSTPITLWPEAVTSVNYEFGPNSLFSSGDVRSFKEGEGLSINTTPEGAEITLDGEKLGKTPLITAPNKGTHKLRVSHGGYVTRELEINIEPKLLLSLKVWLSATPLENPKVIEEGKINIYDLSTSNESLLKNFSVWSEGAFFFEKETGYIFDILIDRTGNMYYKDKAAADKKVADGKEITIGYLGDQKDIQISEEAAAVITSIKKDFGPQKKAVPKQSVQISSTPTGILNVRSGPGTNYPILEKIKPGEKYELLEEKGDWYKINVSGTEGWISKQYAKKL